MFTDGLMECRLDEITLNGVTAKGMRNLLDFAYSSKILINSDNVEDILSAANHIQIMPVVDACVKYLQSQVTLSNCIDMVTMAELFCLRDLKDYIYKFMSSNFSSLHMCAEFLRLSPAQLETLLDLKCPVDCSECDVLSAVIAWIVHHHGYSATHAVKYLSKINFENVSADEFSAMVNAAAFDHFLADGQEVDKIQSFMRRIHSCSGVNVSGLINVRGFEESLVVCGGFRAGRGMTNDIHYYSKEKQALKYLTTVPHVEQCNSGLAVVNNKLYVVGGCYNADQLDDEIIHCYAFCYDPVTQKWTNIAPMLEERCRFYLGSIENKLYAIGGDPGASRDMLDTSPCECYNIDTNTWSHIAMMPGSRMEHAGTVLKKQLYVSGGLQDPEGPVFNTFFKYDPAQNEWHQLPSMITPRADHSMFTYKDRIYTIGGWFEDLNTHERIMASTIDCFDPVREQWETYATSINQRLFASYTVHGTQVMVVGGWWDGDYQQKCDAVDQFDLVRRTWSRGDAALGQLWEHGSCSMYLPRDQQG